ncbi:MAG: hypothetical protein KAQ69_06615 [Spirochaetales bacterium]|nr:hypothetical protein [Spirochaetales bacterium]
MITNKKRKNKLTSKENSTAHPVAGWIKLLPGLLLAIGVMLSALLIPEILGKILPFEKNPVSPILVTIIIGLLIRNLINLPEIVEPLLVGLAAALSLGLISFILVNVFHSRIMF